MTALKFIFIIYKVHFIDTNYSVYNPMKTKKVKHQTPNKEHQSIICHLK